MPLPGACAADLAQDPAAWHLPLGHFDFTCLRSPRGTMQGILACCWQLVPRSLLLAIRILATPCRLVGCPELADSIWLCSAGAASAVRS